VLYASGTLFVSLSTYYSNMSEPLNMIRKKTLKIQERLGMRVGIAYGISKTPIVKTAEEAENALMELYKVGFKAFLLPKELFSRIKDPQDIFKEHYSELLRIKTIAQKYNIELALHHDELPEEPHKLDTVLKIFFNLAHIMDCRTFIIHPNFYKNVPQQQALKILVHKINETVNSMNLKIKIGIETTGRVNELGSLEDVIEITKRTTQTEPIINFANIHGRSAGFLRDESNFRFVFNKIKTDLGQQSLQNSYFLFSGVTYGPSGVIKYLPSTKSDLKLVHLIKSVMSFGAKGTLIFEDPQREQSILDILKEFGDMVR